MERLTIDDPLKSQLFSTSEPLILCDSNGSAFGHFVPIVLSKGQDNCPYSQEQLKAMRSESGGTSLAEVWKSGPQSLASSAT